MRVIAGELGGRRLRAPRGRGTRPTSDRTREAIFSILGDVRGARVLDLFAGSGALAIEALSRGAAQAVLVDRDRSAIRVMLDNVGQLELGMRAIVTRADVRDELPAGEFDLVFVDPPYASAASFGPLLDRCLPPLLGARARVVTESDHRDPLALRLPLGRERRYGDTLIRVYVLAPA